MIVKEGQSIVDVCMEGYGSINEIVKLALDNGLLLDEIPPPGTEVEVDESLGNKTIKRIYKRDGIIPSSQRIYTP